MSAAHCAGAIMIAIRNNSNPSRITEHQINQTTRKCELDYGEICYACEAYIGDAIGKRRMCSECSQRVIPEEPKPKRYTWLWIIGIITLISFIIYELY